VAVSFTSLQDDSEGVHRYQVFAESGDPAWLESVAKEYVALRTATAAPLSEVSLEGIDVVSVDLVQKRLAQAVIPHRKSSPLDVVRSDFGEVLLYALLEGEHGTKLGYKSIRDRELIQLAGRGIDAVGVEDCPEPGCIALVLGEAKVSDEDRSPPRVVDAANDSLREQHLGNLADRGATADKIFDQSRHVANAEVRNRLIAAALLLEDERWDKLRIVACCALVRSTARLAPGDFGTFRATPSDYTPAAIRFLVVRLPESVEDTVTKWYQIVQRLQAAA
jgi:hypothetical protein